MYQWRQLTEEDRAALLSWRQHLKRPWHSPPHFATGPGCFHLTAACYDHAEIIGQSVKRMQDFGEDLIRTLDQVGATLHAWCLLPNHYHLLLDVPDLKKTTSSLGLLHGRTSLRGMAKKGCAEEKSGAHPPTEKYGERLTSGPHSTTSITIP